MVFSVRNILSFFLFFCSFALTASSPTDSIYLSIKTSNIDNDIDSLYSIGSTIYRGNPELARDLANKMIILNRNSKNKTTNFSNANHLLGISYLAQNDITNALIYCRKAYSLRKKANDLKGAVMSLSNIGICYEIQSQYDSAMVYYTKCLSIDHQLKDSVGLGYDYINIGNVYWSEYKLDSTIYYYKKAFNLRLELRDTVGIATCLSNLAGVCIEFKKYKDAISYCREAEKIVQKIDDKYSLGVIYSQIGASYQNLLREDSATTYFERALTIYTQINHKRGIAKSQSRLAKLYYTQKKQKEALDLLTNSIAIYRAGSFINELIPDLKLAAQISFENNDYDNAIVLCKESYTLAGNKNQSDYQAECAELLGLCYQKKGNYQLRSLYLDSALLFLKKIRNMEKSSAIDFAAYKTDIETKSKKIEIDKLNLEKEKQKLAIKNRNNTIAFTIVALVLFFVLSVIAYRKFYKEKKLKAELERKNAAIERQKKIIEDKNNDIFKSISYAEKIQQAFLPNPINLNIYFADSFILYLPKDVVSGDFYWIEKREESIYFAAVDCTGHGVPGAIMSSLGYSILNQALFERKLDKPSEILFFLSKTLNALLKQDDKSVKDGMDIVLCKFNKTTKILTLSGAMNPAYFISDNIFKEYKTSKTQIGYHKQKDASEYQDVEIPVKRGDCLYLLSDGFADQFGGPKNKKYKYAPLKELLLSIHSQKMNAQKQLLHNTFLSWKKEEEQTDDVLLMGIRF
ncbi:MAG: tetratricopeptide repeat protein [Bacteroidetes bacterium]|nr:tetratricopeptide repeat protein [Bacteroidota bacterium]